jgi:hypothetical protein
VKISKLKLKVAGCLLGCCSLVFTDVSEEIIASIVRAMTIRVHGGVLRLEGNHVTRRQGMSTVFIMSRSDIRCSFV